MKKPNIDLEIDIEVIRDLRNHDFRQFKQDTKSPSTFAGDKKLWQEHVGQFFVDDNIFDDHKNFIPGLFIHPAFQQLCNAMSKRMMMIYLQLQKVCLIWTLFRVQMKVIYKKKCLKY